MELIELGGVDWGMIKEKLPGAADFLKGKLEEEIKN